MCQNKPFVGDAAAAKEAAALGSNLEACAKVQTSTRECSVCPTKHFTDGNVDLRAIYKVVKNRGQGFIRP